MTAAKPRKKITKPNWVKDMRFRLPLSVGLAALVGLCAHVWLEVWAAPIIKEMASDFTPPDENDFRFYIFIAYVTSCIGVGLIAFLYHHLGRYMPVRRKWLRVLVLAGVVLEIRGDLIRQPVMDYLSNRMMGLHEPFQFVVVNQMDKWVASLLLSAVIVYLCPMKKDTSKKKA